jgi:hypothetical protein
MHDSRRDNTHTPSRRTHLALYFCALALASVYSACAAASRSPDPTRPRADDPPYPVTLTSDKDRNARALNAWSALAHNNGLAPNAPAPELQPVIATPRALPSSAVGALHLPLVEIKTGSKENQDEATRESLRRFIASAGDLLGGSLNSLSLAEIASDGTARVARYRQKPFPYPLRGGYGRIEIRFAPDRTVLALSSTAIPDTERLTRALVAARARTMPAEQVASKLAGRTFTFTTNAGATETHTVAAGEPINPRALVVYPLARAGDPDTLELRLAWEAQVGATGDLLVYLDAVTGETIAAARQTPPTQEAQPVGTP